MADQPQRIGVIGVPFDKGQPKKGVNNGPKMMREAGIIKMLADTDFDVKDYGDVHLEDITDDDTACNVNRPRTIGGDMKRVSDKVKGVVKGGSMCLTLGGDHTIAIGTIHGHLQVKPDTVVVWVDAHADINPPTASPSGNIHGMPVAFLANEVKKYVPDVPGFEWLKPCLPTKNLAYIGLRDLDPAEKKLIKELGITVYDMYDVERLGIHQVMEGVMSALNPRMDKPIHLSFDIDGLDPIHAPSTGTPVPGGLSLREGMYIVEHLMKTGKLSAFDLVEVNPSLGSKDDVKATVKTACDMVASGLGRRAIYNIPRDYDIPTLK